VRLSVYLTAASHARPIGHGRHLTEMRPRAFAAVALSAAASVFAAAAEDDDCADRAVLVLNGNAPGLALAPGEVAIKPNAFLASQRHLLVSWDHLHELIGGDCVESYMVEYGRGALTARAEAPTQHGRQKRESAANDASVTPPISPQEGLQRVIGVADGCGVYDARLVAAVRLSAGKATHVRSKARLFWPPAYAADVEAYSDSLLLSWPPYCAHATIGWTLRACSTNQNDCQEQALAGGSPLHLSGLRACSEYELDLLSASGESMWATSTARTLPRPNFSISAGHRNLNVSHLSRLIVATASASSFLGESHSGTLSGVRPRPLLDDYALPA